MEGSIKVLWERVQLSTDRIVWNTLVWMGTAYDEIYHGLIVFGLLSTQLLALPVPDIQPLLATIILLTQTCITSHLY